LVALATAEFFVPAAFDFEREKEIEGNSTQSDEWVVQACAGTCQNTANGCSSGYKSGMCPGPSNIKCCPQSTPKCSGQCQDTSLSCGGSYVSGLCPGPANVKCCTSSGGGGGGGGGSSGGASCTPVGSVGGVSLCQWGNCKVSTSIGSNFARMMNAAAAAGRRMGCNSSFRDPADQIRLRRQNCGTSNYDIYQKPSSQCHPPTAIPGSSQHEKGLAVDLNCNGASFGGSSCFSWMASNARTYGFKNYAPEPWHWSTTGT
jgi:hypothetical protein